MSSTHLKGRNAIGWIAAIVSWLYFTLLFYIVFAARRRKDLDPVLMRSYLTLTPFKKKYFTLIDHSLITHAERVNFYSDLFGNILMFMPFPFFLILMFRVKKSFYLIAIPFLTSIFIECIQYAFGIGVASTDDVILNTLGASIGALVCSLIFSKPSRSTS